MLKSLFIPLLLELICLIFRFIKKKIQRVDLFVVFINLIMILQVFFETVNHVWHNGDYVLFPMRHGYIMIFAVISGSAIMLSLVPGDTAPEALASSGLLKFCNAFVFLEFALAVYCLVCVLKTGELPWVWLIFSISGLVFWGTKLIETKRLSDPGDSDEE